MDEWRNFSRKYHEDISQADQFFLSIDVNGDKELSETDFIFQAFHLDPDCKYKF